MNNINQLINEVKEMEKNIYKENITFLIKTSDILENLKQYELLDYITYELNQDTEDYEEIYLEDKEEYLNYLIDYCYIDINKSKSDNTYNWKANITNDIDFIIYYNELNNNILVELKVHLNGDIRSNYTDSILLHFDNEEQFFDVMQENYIIDIVEVDGIEFNLFTSFFNEEITINKTDNDNIEFYTYEYEYQYIIEEIKNYLKEN